MQRLLAIPAAICACFGIWAAGSSPQPSTEPSAPDPAYQEIIQLIEPTVQEQEQQRFELVELGQYLENLELRVKRLEHWKLEAEPQLKSLAQAPQPKSAEAPQSQPPAAAPLAMPQRSVERNQSSTTVRQGPILQRRPILRQRARARVGYQASGCYTDPVTGQTICPQ